MQSLSPTFNGWFWAKTQYELLVIDHDMLSIGMTKTCNWLKLWQLLHLFSDTCQDNSSMGHEKDSWIEWVSPGRFQLNISYANFKLILVIDGWSWGISCENVFVTGPHWWSVNIGSGNGLVPSGSKPLPVPMLTQIYVTIWQASLSHNELISSAGIWKNSSLT